MKEYMIALFGVCCVAAVVKNVSSGNAMKKHIEIVCALCVISALVLPIFDVFSDFKGIDFVFEDNSYLEDDYVEIYNQYLVEKRVDLAETAISSSVCNSLGVADGAIRIKLYLDDSGAQIISATAVISKDAVTADPAEIALHIRQTLGVECEVVYQLFDE